VTENDLTIKTLQGIREDLQGLRTEQEASRREQEAFRREQEAFRREQEAFRRESNQHFEVIETALRDIAEQLVMLSRGVKAAIEVRPRG
jgi:septation ring formation regulator EzrA